jgi:hypothetical protein
MASIRSSCSMIAGIAIWDAEKNVTLTQDLMQHGSNHAPYERMKVTGWPIKTLGSRLCRDGQGKRCRVAVIWTIPRSGDVVKRLTYAPTDRFGTKELEVMALFPSKP